MPRIDPLQLLKCLSVLLKPTGGIKSKDEVQRLASLMTKFSKKLVSKCIYVSILKATDTDLLIMFMTAGGWDLIYTWLSDGVAAKNWPLVNELLNLLLIYPVNIERLKTNACPKLIKTLSKDVTADESGRLLACKLVEQWLKVVRRESDPVPGAIIAVKDEVKDIPSDLNEVKKEDVLFEANQLSGSNSGESAHSDEVKEEEDIKSESAVGESQLPVYKITIRDGKQVLAEVFSGDRTSVGRTSVDSAEADIDGEESDDDDIKPVKVSKKCYVNRTKANSVAKRPVKIKNEITSRDSIDSNSSTVSNKSLSRIKVEKKTPVKKSKSLPPVKDVKSKTKPSVTREKQNISKEKPKEKDKKSDKFLSLEKKDVDKGGDKDKKDVSAEKEKINKDKTEKELQEERDFKESISKIITPSISKLGKIPKKSGNKEEDESKKESTKVLGSPDGKKSSDIKKPPEIKKTEKKYSISVEPKRLANIESRPKTVKTFNSKFRSTGLEETPPPPKPVPKKNSVVLSPPSTLTFSDRKPLKRMSPPPDLQPLEKKIKPDSPQEEKKLDKVGGIKLIPAKPKPMFLEESDVFMNALTAANQMKEPRKRKRRPSASKEGAPDIKKESTGNSSTPPSSPLQTDEKSPPIAKPTFKFYQDTLETSIDEEKYKTEKPETEESLDFAQPDQEMTDLSKEGRSLSPDDIKLNIRSEIYDKSGTLIKGVLVSLKSRRGPKKSVCWKEEKELEEIRYFEMDETERVNVTKNFLDMKQMERINERENFQMARKLAVEDIMEERARWKALIPCDSSGAAVISGKNSIEKDIQYAREKTVAAAFYFNKRAIPDTAAEPDLEIHATTDPAMIPLEDITGITDSINDFTSTAWPEPQVQSVLPPQPEPIMQPHPLQPIPPVYTPQVPTAFAPVPFQPGPPGFMPSPSQLPPGDWRTGDGKILPVPDMYQPQPLLGPMGPPHMMPQPLMATHGPPDMGFPMGMPGPGPMDDMGHFGHPFPMGPNMGPPGMISPPYQTQGPMPGPLPPQDYPGNSNNERYRNDDHGGGRGNWFCGNGPGPYQSNRGNHRGGNWRGGMDRRENRDNRDNRDRDSNKSWGCNSRGICNMFIKRGYCKNNKCHFRHPNSNRN